MNNLPPRIIFSAVGILLLLVMIVNHFLNKELVVAVPVSIPVVIEEEKVAPPIKIEEKDYDIHSDYSPVPTTEGLAQEVFAVEKKTERVLDEKIIYEMPTSNRFLLQ